MGVGRATRARGVRGDAWPGKAGPFEHRNEEEWVPRRRNRGQDGEKKVQTVVEWAQRKGEVGRYRGGNRTGSQWDVRKGRKGAHAEEGDSCCRGGGRAGA